MPSSLALPSRTSKPRKYGLTVVIDNGAPTGLFADAVKSAAGYIDYVKFGWGTALVTADLNTKTALLEELGIGFFFGGTLFEKFVAQNRFDDYLGFCAAQRCPAIEISNGTISLDSADKQRLIAKAAEDFTVFAEVGYKDPDRSQSLASESWVEFIYRDYVAGASYVIAEARETGSSGISHPDGRPRVDLVEEILANGPDPAHLIFEAPTKALQTFFVTRLGANVNLGNIGLQGVLATETLRLGLRSDTLLHFELEPASSKVADARVR
jgi:phosphosulfolactate synthase